MNEKKLPNQVVGNIGLYYVCYELSKRGWNVLPTSRNTRGVDIVIFSQDVKRTHTIQVKALSGRSALPFGEQIENKLIAEYLIVVRKVLDEKPEVFVAKMNEIRDVISKSERGEKISYWVEYKDYEKYKDNWGVLGSGLD